MLRSDRSELLLGNALNAATNQGVWSRPGSTGHVQCTKALKSHKEYSIVNCNIQCDRVVKNANFATKNLIWAMYMLRDGMLNAPEYGACDDICSQYSGPLKIPLAWRFLSKKWCFIYKKAPHEHKFRGAFLAIYTGPKVCSARTPWIQACAW